jgi:hypothetical protein
MATNSSTGGGGLGTAGNNCGLPQQHIGPDSTQAVIQQYNESDNTLGVLQQAVLGPLELDKLPKRLRKKEQKRWKEAREEGSCSEGEALSAEFEQLGTKGPSLHILYHLGPAHQ